MIKETLGSTGLICCSINVHNLNKDLVSQVASNCLLSLKKDYKALISQKAPKNQSDKKHKGWSHKLLLKSLLSNLANIYIGTNICLTSGTSVSLYIIGTELSLQSDRVV